MTVNVVTSQVFPSSIVNQISHHTRGRSPRKRYDPVTSSGHLRFCASARRKLRPQASVSIVEPASYLASSSAPARLVLHVSVGQCKYLAGGAGFIGMNLVHAWRAVRADDEGRRGASRCYGSQGSRVGFLPKNSAG
jgi:hypothetical protein